MIMSQTSAGKRTFFFLLSFFLINTVSFTSLLAAIAFISGSSVQQWFFPVSVILATIINFYAAGLAGNKEKRSIFLKSLLAGIFIIISAILIAGYFYDTSADGLVYHQETIYQLKTGWNPVNKILPDSVNQAIWINHYAKGAEIPQASIYSMTNRIETGKATNIILLAGSFFLTASALSVFGRLTMRKVLLLSGFLVLNPVTINQLFTYYVDGQLACLLVCLLAIFILIYKSCNRYYLLLLISLIIITVNIKFTALVFTAFFAMAFLSLLLVLKKIKLFRKVFYSCLAGALLGVVLVGYNPYIINTVNYNHPFYPLMGESSIDIIQESYPIGFSEKGRFEKFFISFFSHTDNEGSWAWEERRPTLKLPFTFNKVDISNARTEDTRVAGFGPFFSGIFLMAFLFFLIASIRYQSKSIVSKVLYIVAVLLVSVLVVPEAWWARYVPQLWIIPLLLIVAIEMNNSIMPVFLKRLFYLFVFFNISFSLLSVPYRILMTLQLEYQLRQLEASGTNVNVEWGNAKTNRVRFMEHNIPFREQKIDKAVAIEIIGSDSKFEKPGSIPPVSMPLLLKWWRGIKPENKLD